MANEEIWIVGDSLLTQVAGAYYDMKHAKHQLYLWDNYDVHVYTMAEGNYLMKLQSGMIEGLMRRPRLPSKIVAILSDNPYKSETVFYFKAMERVIKWICGMIVSSIKKRKEQLPHKAIKYGLPKIFVTKPLLFKDKQQDFLLDAETGYRKEPLPSKTRKFGILVDKIVNSYAIQAIDLKFDDTDSSLYNTSKTQLTTDGCQLFWMALSDEIRALDELRTNQMQTKFKKGFSFSGGNKGRNTETGSQRGQYNAHKRTKQTWTTQVKQWQSPNLDSVPRYHH